jgi:hypothetical protein
MSSYALFHVLVVIFVAWFFTHFGQLLFAPPINHIAEHHPRSLECPGSVSLLAQRSRDLSDQTTLLLRIRGVNDLQRLEVVLLRASAIAMPGRNGTERR